VLGNFVKRLFNAAILFFGVFAFFTVPLGEKTGAEHAVAIFTTPPAREAGAAIASAAQEIVDRAVAEVEKVRSVDAVDAGAPP